MLKQLLTLVVFASGIGFGIESAEPLRFTSGSVSAYSNVTLNVEGPSNLVVQLERLNRTNDTWEAQGNCSLTNGFGTFNSTLIEGIHGFYRALGTNNPGTTNSTLIYSTNGYGAFAGFCPTGYTLVGNIFGRLSITNVVPDAPYGTMVYKWHNLSNSYEVFLYDEFDGYWLPHIPDIAETEAVFIRNTTSNTFRYLISGLFSTNVFLRELQEGLTLLTTPLYRITATNTWRVDTLSSSDISGLSDFPVTGPMDPQTILYQMNSTTPTYQTNSLRSYNAWEHLSTDANIHLGITEGFWFDKSTNGIWTISRPLW